MENKKVYIIKVGGQLLDDFQLLKEFLLQLKELKSPFVLVHGGGKSATHLATQLHIEPFFIEGRRVTNEPMLDVAVMVYAGLINKKIISLLQSMKINSFGLCGADGQIITSKKREIENFDFGFVGDIYKVDGAVIRNFIEQDYAVVLSAITDDGNGQLLNTNADTIASEVALALANIYEVELVYCFEKEGVLLDVNNPSSIIMELNEDLYFHLKSEGNVDAGMIPKLDNAFYAFKGGVKHVRILNGFNLSKLINNEQTGTNLVR